MPEFISESAFYMWRTLFAIAHADAIVTIEEKNFMNTILAEKPFTPEQSAILRRDIEQRQDIRSLFEKITDQHDRSAFFNHARNLVWIDGDFGVDEQKIMTELSTLHFKSIDHATFDDVAAMSLDEIHTDQPTAALTRDGLVMRVLKSLAGI